MAMPDKEVCIVGHSNRVNSASAAAGAMCNVFGEVESCYSPAQKRLVDLSLWYGLAGRAGWLDFFELDPQFENLVTAKDTLVFLKKENSDFERKNYEEARKIADEHDLVEEVKLKDISAIFQSATSLPLDAFKIKGEFAIDTKVLFVKLDELCKSLGIQIIHSEVKQVELSGSQVLTQEGPIGYNRLVVALGSNSAKVLPTGIMQNLVQGVGTAINISDDSQISGLIRQNFVIRTVNRGGAQCGFHFVPRQNGFYLGAGNYIMGNGDSNHRIETVRYLFNTFEDEVCGPTISYKVEGDFVKGHRPRSLDGFPLIGGLRTVDNVFVATGTNRAGLTWAPKIAQQVVVWAKGELEDVPFADWVAPDRKFIDFGTMEEAINYYTESRLGGALEHKKIPNDSYVLSGERARLKLYAGNLLEQVNKVVSPGLGVPHPDHWAIFLDQPFLCS